MSLHSAAVRIYEYILETRNRHRLNVRQDNGLLKYTVRELAEVLGLEPWRAGVVVGNAMTLLHEHGLVKILRRKRGGKTYVYVIEVPS